MSTSTSTTNRCLLKMAPNFGPKTVQNGAKTVQIGSNEKSPNFLKPPPRRDGGGGRRRGAAAAAAAAAAASAAAAVAATGPKEPSI